MAQLTTQITVAGNLTRDPELRYTQGGQQVASFALATTPRSYNKDTKQYEDGDPLYTTCTLWGKAAENLVASAVKGSRLLVSGQLRSRSYESRDGEKKAVTELLVDEVGVSVMFTSYTRNAQQRSSAPATQPQSPAQPPMTQQYGDEVPW